MSFSFGKSTVVVVRPVFGEHPGVGFVPDAQRVTVRGLDLGPREALGLRSHEIRARLEVPDVPRPGRRLAAPCGAADSADTGMSELQASVTPTAVAIPTTTRAQCRCLCSFSLRRPRARGHPAEVGVADHRPGASASRATSNPSLALRAA